MPHRISPDLIRLAQSLGDPAMHYVIYGEGDVSGGIDGKSFLIKAAGRHLLSVRAEDFAVLHFEPLLELVARRPNANHHQVQECLKLAGRAGDPPPSSEAFFHAVLLDLPGVKFVGHTHPSFVAGIMASPKAQVFAHTRLFPQHVEFCGPRSLFVPYMDPGLRLAADLRDRLERYLNEYGAPPSTVLLGNHGMIALGATPEAILAATGMMQKAAHAYITAQACGGAQPIPESDIQRLMAKG